MAGFMLTRTVDEWADIPIEMAYGNSRDEDCEFLEPILATTQDEAGHADIVESFINHSGEPVERYRIHPELRITSRRCAGTAEWDVILQVPGVTANVMGVTGGTFAVAKFVALVWRKTKERSIARGHRDDLSVLTPAAAALLAANWLMENHPHDAQRVLSSGGHLHAHPHSTHQTRYYIVSMTSNDLEILLVVSEDGSVTRVLP